MQSWGQRACHTTVCTFVGRRGHTQPPAVTEGWNHATTTHRHTLHTTAPHTSNTRYHAKHEVFTMPNLPQIARLRSRGRSKAEANRRPTTKFLKLDKHAENWLAAHVPPHPLHSMTVHIPPTKINEIKVYRAEQCLRECSAQCSDNTRGAQVVTGT